MHISSSLGLRPNSRWSLAFCSIIDILFEIMVWLIFVTIVGFVLVFLTWVIYNLGFYFENFRFVLNWIGIIVVSGLLSIWVKLPMAESIKKLEDLRYILYSLCVFSNWVVFAHKIRIL